MKRILSLTLVVVMVLGCLTVLSACGPKPQGNTDAPVSYTYNTYLSEFPTKWNPHTYETATDSEIPGYTELGFYTFDYNEDWTGFEVVPQMAAQMPIDVTADYVGDEWGIDEDETARAWKIVLRDDLRWENGDPITAVDFIESAKRLLDPKRINYRADSLYSGDMSIVGAKDYFYGGRLVTVAASSEFDTYSEDLDSELIFSLAGPSEKTNGNATYIVTWLISQGIPSSYTAAQNTSVLINNFGGKMPDFTAEVSAAMEGKTLAEIKADPDLKKGWDSLIGWWQTDPNEELHFFMTKVNAPVTEWSTVGILPTENPLELVLILESELSGFYLHYSLTGSLGLVHIPTYDACASFDENGLYSTTYGTSVETYMSYGPYKLTYFERDKQIVLEKNNQWYGYYDPAHEGQYQTTRVVYDWINDPETAMEAFLQGKLDGKGLDSDYIAQYTGSDRIYYTDGASTWFVALNPNEAFFAEWEANNPGYDKSIMTMKEFRMALSFSLDRQNFINTLDPMGSIAYGLFNNMICSNPDLGIMYRDEEAAKDAILDFWGISQDQIGEGKMFANKDQAIKSITGYNMSAAKELFNKAFDAAVEAGIYNGKDKILIKIGTPNSTSKFYTRGYTFLVNCWTEAVKGTKLEGLLEFTNDDTLGNSFGDALRANTVDMLFGVGWQGSALNPYGLIGAYTEDNYRYDKAWNTSTHMMDFTADDGVTYRASVLEWTKAVDGSKSIEVQVVGEDGELTGDTADFSCGSADNKPEERIRLLAAIEGAVLANYDMIPTHNQASASLLGKQVEYGKQEYVYGVGRGGIQYMTYNYTDAEWDAYVKSLGGVIDYK